MCKCTEEGGTVLVYFAICCETTDSRVSDAQSKSLSAAEGTLNPYKVQRFSCMVQLQMPHPCSFGTGVNAPSVKSKVGSRGGLCFFTWDCLNIFYQRTSFIPSKIRKQLCSLHFTFIFVATAAILTATLAATLARTFLVGRTRCVAGNGTWSLARKQLPLLLLLHR